MPFVGVSSIRPVHPPTPPEETTMRDLIEHEEGRRADIDAVACGVLRRLLPIWLDESQRVGRGDVARDESRRRVALMAVCDDGLQPRRRRKQKRSGAAATSTATLGTQATNGASSSLGVSTDMSSPPPLRTPGDASPVGDSDSSEGESDGLLRHSPRRRRCPPDWLGPISAEDVEKDTVERRARRARRFSLNSVLGTPGAELVERDMHLQPWQSDTGSAGLGTVGAAVVLTSTALATGVTTAPAAYSVSGYIAGPFLQLLMQSLAALALLCITRHTRDCGLRSLSDLGFELWGEPAERLLLTLQLSVVSFVTGSALRFAAVSVADISSSDSMWRCEGRGALVLVGVVIVLGELARRLRPRGRLMFASVAVLLALALLILLTERAASSAHVACPADDPLSTAPCTGFGPGIASGVEWWEPLFAASAFFHSFAAPVCLCVEVQAAMKDPYCMPNSILLSLVAVSLITLAAGMPAAATWLRPLSDDLVLALGPVGQWLSVFAAVAATIPVMAHVSDSVLSFWPNRMGWGCGEGGNGCASLYGWIPRVLCAISAGPACIVLVRLAGGVVLGSAIAALTGAVTLLLIVFRGDSGSGLPGFPSDIARRHRASLWVSAGGCTLGLAASVCAAVHVVGYRSSKDYWC
eukprot:TRINITY_DN10386_c0_g1_i2.p1 TRINITY_DN10386_c0_g1~~TRINITY_DN10386_c0_g1_i2.p1  ORF type:complete len:639 (+),score=151.87 TRINITY_DN10386_c0_g1_i2:153-2069(+)